MNRTPIRIGVQRPSLGESPFRGSRQGTEVRIRQEPSMKCPRPHCKGSMVEVESLTVVGIYREVLCLRPAVGTSCDSGRGRASQRETAAEARGPADMTDVDTGASE